MKNYINSVVLILIVSASCVFFGNMQGKPSHVAHVQVRVIVPEDKVHCVQNPINKEQEAYKKKIVGISKFLKVKCAALADTVKNYYGKAMSEEKSEAQGSPELPSDAQIKSKSVLKEGLKSNEKIDPVLRNLLVLFEDFEQKYAANKSVLAKVEGPFLYSLERYRSFVTKATALVQSPSLALHETVAAKKQWCLDVLLLAIEHKQLYGTVCRFTDIAQAYAKDTASQAMQQAHALWYKTLQESEVACFAKMDIYQHMIEKNNMIALEQELSSGRMASGLAAIGALELERAMVWEQLVMLFDSIIESNAKFLSDIVKKWNHVQKNMPFKKLDVYCRTGIWNYV